MQTNPAQDAAVQTVLNTATERFDDERKNAIAALQKLVTTAQREITILESGRFGSTDFVSQRAEEYNASLIRMVAFSESISSLNWLLRQLKGEEN